MPASPTPTSSAAAAVRVGAPLVCRRADALLADAVARQCVLPTGMRALDALLHGGWHTGHVHELVGDTAAYKSRVALLALMHCVVASAAADDGATALYLDSSNNFSIAGLLDAHQQRRPSDDDDDDDDDAAAAAAAAADVCSTAAHERAQAALLCRVRVVPVFDSAALLAALATLTEDLRAQRDAFSTRVRLVVVDSAGALFSPVVGPQPAGHARMATAMQTLRRLAATYQLAVVVTNHTVRDGRAALGEAWAREVHTRVRLHAPPASAASSSLSSLSSLSSSSSSLVRAPSHSLCAASPFVLATLEKSPRYACTGRAHRVRLSSSVGE